MPLKEEAGDSREIFRENGSAASKPATTRRTLHASAISSEKIDTQSSVRHAGTTPVFGISPSDGFNPTMLLSIAGTRPEPAVSVPSEMGTRPAATAAAEPELEPPGMRSSRK